MSIEINVPDIGMDEAEVTEIMVKVGDKVNFEQSLITVEGAKASIEVPAPQAGIVKEIKVVVGDKITTGKLIMLFDVEEKITEINPNLASDLNFKIDKIDTKNIDKKNSILKEVILPNIGDDEAEVTEIMVKVGDKVNFEQSLITVEGEKASMKVLSPFSGEVKEIKIAKGDKIKRSSLIMSIAVDASIASSVNTNAEFNNREITEKLNTSTPVFLCTEKTNAVSEIQNDFFKNHIYIHATPLVRRLARQFGVNLSKINGTGHKGRILREDLQAYIKKTIEHSQCEERIKTDGFSEILPWPKVDFNRFGEVEEVQLTRIQKASSSNLSRSWRVIPHVTIMEDTDITELEVFRKQQNKEIEKLQMGVKITPLVFVMKAVARGLEKIPRFNSSISTDAQKLILKKYIHIGIAVDTQNGLFVPVIRDVNKKGIIELSKELMEVSRKARSGKLTASNTQGGSFTISSLGSIGTTSFTPIINAPEVAIIGLSRSSIKPVWNGSKFIPRLILPMSLSFDHRVIDGADAARFLTYIARLITDIRRLIM